VANESSYRKTHLSTERKTKGEVKRSRKKGEGERKIEKAVTRKHYRVNGAS
jgi:hypothetical protein